MAVASVSVIGASQSSVARAASPSVTSYAATDQGVASPVHQLAAHNSATTGTASTRAHGARFVHSSGAAAASLARTMRNSALNAAMDGVEYTRS